MSDEFYLVDSNKMYTLLQPTPLHNLLTMYKLDSVAQSLARIKSDGSKGVKLRKSYKNHIADLPGKHLIPPPSAIPPQMLDPEFITTPNTIHPVDPALLKQALRFDKTPLNGIPGFNTADLAINDQQTLMRGDDPLDTDEKRHKRKRKSLGYIDVKRQHIGHVTSRDLN